MFTLELSLPGPVPVSAPHLPRDVENKVDRVHPRHRLIKWTPPPPHVVTRWSDMCVGLGVLMKLCKPSVLADGFCFSVQQVVSAKNIKPPPPPLPRHADTPHTPCTDHMYESPAHPAQSIEHVCVYVCVLTLPPHYHYHFVLPKGAVLSPAVLPSDIFFVFCGAEVPFP